MKNVVVIGSISMDIVVTSQKRPIAGETVIGESFHTVPGGKGANQAVAASRLGANVTMIGCVGVDHYGDIIIKNLQSNNINTDYIKRITNSVSGTAHITLVDGDNSIIVVKGANDFVTKDYVDEVIEVIKKADMIILQHEIPMKTVEYIGEICEKHGIALLLNPAPACSISEELIERATYITPNEHEAAVLFKGMNQAHALKQYANKVLITEGVKGVRFHNGTEEQIVPTFPVDVVDTTGAGDTFNGAFAVAITEGKEILDVLRFANRAASISVTKFGAQGGMPYREEVDKKLNAD